MLTEWLDRAISDIPGDRLPDEQVLALADLQMEAGQTLRYILNLHRSGALPINYALRKA